MMSGVTHESPNPGWFTAGDLKRILEDVPDHFMICTAEGHTRRITIEPGANEPFVLLWNPEDWK